MVTVWVDCRMYCPQCVAAVFSLLFPPESMAVADNSESQLVKGLPRESESEPNPTEGQRDVAFGALPSLSLEAAAAPVPWALSLPEGSAAAAASPGSAPGSPRTPVAQLAKGRPRSPPRLRRPQPKATAKVSRVSLFLFQNDFSPQTIGWCYKDNSAEERLKATGAVCIQEEWSKRSHSRKQ